ncbi:MAG: hypothetical protein M3N57_06745 [Actinomycetota bacterium]|nr:hypothetical protein [Actinomycetota bacterium]
MAAEAERAAVVAASGGWLGALGGLAVVGTVGGLLGAIWRHAKELDAEMTDVWLMGKQVASNTATVWMLEETAAIAGQLRDALRSSHG